MRSLLNQKTVNCTRSESGQNTLKGMAAVYYDEADQGTEYRLYGAVRERILPGAFDGVRDADIISTVNHDPNQLLGTTSSGTFRFDVTPDGVAYEIDLPDTQLGRDIATLAERGDIDGSSFWFDFGESVYNKRTDDEGEIWELQEVRGLVEMGPVTVPAYKSTTAFKRSQEMTELETSRNLAATTRLKLLAKSRGL